MTIPPERLAAYADGQLDGESARAVEAALAQSDDLRADLAAHRALRAQLAAHFAPILSEPVPASLSALIPQGGSGAEVVDFAAMAQRKAVGPPRTWLRWAGPALAASLVLAVLVARPGGSGDYAGGETAQALDTQLAASIVQRGKVRVLLSFANRAGELCRGFTAPEGSGIACRDDDGWRMVRRLPGVSADQRGDYRQAGSTGAGLMAAAQDMAAGDPLDAAAESAARSRGWRN